MTVRAFIVGIILTTVGLMSLAGTARGQTAGPTPTETPASAPVASPVPTPATALPSPKSLLKKTAAAQLKMGSAHFTTTTETSDPTLLDMKQVEKGVVVWKKKSIMLHQTVTTTTTDLQKSPTVTTVEHAETVMAHDVIAARRATGAWQCLGLKQTAQALGGLALGITGGTLHTHVTYTNLGSETVDGVAVWHVHVTVFILGLTPPDHPALEDTYVSTSDNTTVRSSVEETLQLSLNGTVHTIREISQTDYSQYGQKVHIKLPLACKPPKAVMSAALIGTIPPLSRQSAGQWIDRIAIAVKQSVPTM